MPLTMPHPALIAHLDLKGVQPRQAYVLEALETLKSLGYCAVLVEYEDVFPFCSVSFSQHPEEVWSRDFLDTFLAKAEALDLEIIPLQQCLGHLEYAFRFEENRQYSLPDGVPSGLHIGLPEAREWLKSWLREVLEAHPGSRFIHIGMDEARSLSTYAQREGKDVLSLFLCYLDELCTLCEEYGKKPLIWSDMLEEHLAPEHLPKLISFKNRLILVPWDYTATGRPQPVVRLAGVRCTRRWLDEPWNAPLEAPPLRDGMLWFEDWPDAIQSLVKRYRDSPWAMQPFLQAAVWRDLGFTVWGGAGGAITFDRSLLPHYHLRHENIVAWRAFMEENALGGVIITQWARSNGCSAPNLLPDVVWPVLARVGTGLEQLFKGIPPTRLERLFEVIGRCREGWAVEAHALAEMDALTPQLQTHHEEWQTIHLMLELLQIMKGVETLEESGRCYGGMGRLPAIGWEKQRDALCQWKANLATLEKRTRKHLAKRYGGVGLEQWFYKAFHAPMERLAALQRVAAEEIVRATQKKGSAAEPATPRP